MVPWWLLVDLPNISTNTDCFKTLLVLIERFFQGLSVAVKTVRIVKELMEIWPNEVCDNMPVTCILAHTKVCLRLTFSAVHACLAL